MRKFALVGAVIIATALCSAVPLGDEQASAERAYVQASRGAVRAQPASGAPVVDYLATNTEVTVTERNSDWCAVESGAVKGFIACRLLGVEKLTIPTVVAKLEVTGLSHRERLDWVARAFWISPSLVRFEWVGEAMADALAPIEREMREGRRLSSCECRIRRDEEASAAGAAGRARRLSSASHHRPRGGCDGESGARQRGASVVLREGRSDFSRLRSGRSDCAMRSKAARRSPTRHRFFRTCHSGRGLAELPALGRTVRSVYGTSSRQK